MLRFGLGVAIIVWLAGGPLCAGEALPAAQPAATSFTIPAYAYDRGSNIRVRPVGTTPWTDTEPMLHCTGQYPAEVEYDVELPVAATYTLAVYYAAATPRPLELTLDGKPLGPCCQDTTGGWNTSQAKWLEIANFAASAGRHTVKLSRNAGFPHLVALRFQTPTAFPSGWQLQRPQAKTLPASPVTLLAGPNFPALRRALEDLRSSFGQRYPKAAEYLQRLEQMERAAQPGAAAGVSLPGKSEPPRNYAGAEGRQRLQQDFAALAREALLANPLLDFDKLLLVKRSVRSPRLGLPQNWQSNSSLPTTGYEDTLEILSPVAADGRLNTLFQPTGGRFIGDVDLHFDAERLLFSMPDQRQRWQVFELRIDGTGLRQLTGEQPDVDSYDACYLPSGKIVFSSTACFNAVPCTGSDDVAVLYVMDGDGQHVRQLCFDQDHDWCPTVLNNGRVLYTRWEYTDLVHCHSRRLFHMNPDGTEQLAYYGSNSYWPNAIFYARPIPGHPTKVVAVISGHHGVPRMGELVIFDPAQGRHEAEGAVQRIPGFGQKVERVMKDQLADDSWPKFLHPYPLSDKYFLVSAQPTPQSLWGLYLVDVFDNLVLLKELPGYALFEPLPLRRRPAPPVVPDKVDERRRDAVVAIQDIYAGQGLRGLPRGTVKALRVFTYHFAYRGMVTNPNTLGVDGPWDIKRVLGTVSVEADGSAKFHVPANTPISLQPLDAEGKAVQLMRSWLTAMPGELVSCVGCHEDQNTAPLRRTTLADQASPQEIQPWYGPVRGFSFRREVQPVLDRHCIGCHDGRRQADGRELVNLRGDVNVADYATSLSWQRSPQAGKFSVGYVELQRFVRRPGAESDLHVLTPLEFHADTTELLQLLHKGHHGVKLDQEARDRLNTWIDLNCPFHGTRHEELLDPGPQRQRRRELLEKYATADDDAEAVPARGTGLYNRGEKLEPVVPPAERPSAPQAVPCPGWPCSSDEAQRRQQAAGAEWRRTVDLGHGERLEMVLVPAGEFVMGSDAGFADERPRSRVRIDRPFWISTTEITNRQFRLFAPTHDSRVESKNATQYGVQGYPANLPEQPAVRVSWDQARAFCRWLSDKAGLSCELPTEAQWEYAARAGTDTPFCYGGLNDDFSRFANVADAKLAEFASDVWDNAKPLADATRYDEWFPKDLRFNDGALLAVAPGRYRPNAWGLHDMHGNVAEWTRTAYRPYPYDTADGRDNPDSGGQKVVRGGSWFDRPLRCTSSFRLAYSPYQRVFNVGFRVVCEGPVR